MSNERKKLISGTFILIILCAYVIYISTINDPSKIIGPFNNHYDYDDVILIINSNSMISKDIGNYFKIHRKIDNSRVIYIDTIDSEEINLKDFNDYIKKPIEDFLISNNLTDKINYIITTKGVPLKIIERDIFSKKVRSVDSELSLILGPYNSSIGLTKSVHNPYFGRNESISRNKYGIYLVTRLTGYDYKDIKNLIDRSAKTSSKNGTFIFDTTPIDSKYEIFNNEMENAAKILKEEGYNVILENTTRFLTHQNNVLGYVSWGSNDPNAIDNAKTFNNWLPGAIAETAVSTSGRTFLHPEKYGQSLIADLIVEGVTGVKGYVDEPYLDAVAHPDILFPRYVDCYNLAESYYMASQNIGWMDVIVGDPKTSIC